MPHSSSETREALELLLELLPKTYRLSDLLDTDGKKPALRSRNIVRNFQAATYLLCTHLGKLKQAEAVDNAAVVIHRVALCLEKIVGPKHVLINLHEPFNSYPNLHAVHCLPTSSIQAYFYQELKHKGPDFGEQILKKLKQCADELHVTDTGDDYEPIATSQESVDEFDDVWANIKSVYDALVACACETGHIEDFYETTLQLAVKLKQESHNYYGVDILIPRANSSYPNELHFSVTENLRATPQTTSSSEVNRQPETNLSRKLTACSHSVWKRNPYPSFFRSNFALEGTQLWELDPSQRKFPSEEQYEQINLGDLIELKSANWTNVVKLILAVTLAHSLLYLTDGPWLNGSWSRSKIVFYKNRTIIPGRPFLRTQFSDMASPDPRDDFHHYPGNLEFGIALLEIHLGRRIDEPLSSVSRRWGIASKVLAEEHAYMQDDYRNAVKACLEPDFGFTANFTPQQFRKRIFDKIVSPLKKEFENGFKGIIKSNLLDEAASKLDLISGRFSDLSSVHVLPPPIPLKSLPPPRLTRGTVTEREPSAIYIAEKNVVAQSKVSEKLDHLVITSSLLLPPKSTTFTLFEDENQPQDIPRELCQQTDAWIHRFKELVKLKLTSDFADNNRIKVAILDSGIDMENTDIDAQSNRVMSIRSWVDGKAGAEATHDGDISGHGTHISGIILDLAPNVDVYIARVTKNRELEATDQILKAFEYSWKTWNVDMITMSFGFQEDIPLLRKEIKEAVHRGKIVFAAASNDGGNSPRAFPALQNGVICVHSADAYGNRSKYNPNPKKRGDNFSILGEYINSCWPNSEEAGGSRRMTGTSFAAPIAVALAAFIVGYVEQEIPGLRTPTELKSYDGIIALFQLIGNLNEKRNGYDWIAPFEFFRKFSKAKIREDIEDALTP